MTRDSRWLYRELVRIRLVEEAIADRYPEQEIRCPVHLSIGQEAVAVGLCAALNREDRVMSAHRAHAHYLAKGGCLKRMIAELYGKASGCTGGKGGSMHLVDLAVNFMGSTPIVGGSLPVAVGLAFADQRQDGNRVTVAFIGEGATEEGVFCESLNFSALKKLPIVIVCEDNLYSSYSPLSVRQPVERSRIAIAEAHGCLAIEGNGNRLDEVIDIADRAVDHARGAQGPVYVDLKTYRWREHCGPHYDDDLGYRTPKEAAEWRGRCPVAYWETQFDANEIASIRSECQHEIEEAFDAALSAPYPEPEELSAYVYADSIS